MAQAYSFDVTTGVDLQEVDNAVNQAQKEIAQRYDFKGSKATIEFKRAEALLDLTADSEFQMKSLFDVLQGSIVTMRCGERGSSSATPRSPPKEGSKASNWHPTSFFNTPSSSLPAKRIFILPRRRGRI